VQVKVLRLLDQGPVRPLRGTDEAAVDLRFVFAFQHDLAARVEEGRFRQDLYYRVRGVEIVVPPLRERLEDLPALVETLRAELGAGAPRRPWGALVLQALARRHWQGNVRELRNVVARLGLLHGDNVTAEDVERLLAQSESNGILPAHIIRRHSLAELQDLVERQYLIQLQRECRGDLEAMARQIGIKVRALYDRFRRLGLRPARPPQ
jgi:DNA-binding NtrC family response regulator